ncbi:hypothetical protein V8E53_013216 [Lactarius tabidus]
MDNPTADEPPLPPLLTCSHSSHCAAKGKTPVHSPAALAAPLPPSAGPSKSKKCCADTPESENNDNLFAVQDEEAGADADEDTPCKVGQASVVPCVETDHTSPPPHKIPKVIHTSFDEACCGPCITLGITDCKSQLKEPSTMACESCAIKKRKCNPIADWAKPVPDYALYPIQESLDMMEWHFTKLFCLNVAMAGILQVDASTIEAVTAPHPAPRSQSPGGQSGSSPGLGISLLTLSDTHSTASTRSSTRSDNADISKHRHTSLIMSTDHVNVSDNETNDDNSQLSAHWQACPSPLMLSDPLESPSSDALSFDEDDMYGSDPDVETISLLPLRAVHKLETNELLHNDIVSQMDRLNLNMERGTAMLSALCEAAGLDVSSILLNVPAHPSGTLSPQLRVATPVVSRGATDDGN